MHPNMIARSSGELGVGGDQLIYTGSNLVTNMTLRSGTTASLLAVKDGSTIKWSISLIATTAAGDQVHSVAFPGGIKLGSNLTVTVSGTGALAYVAFKPH